MAGFCEHGNEPWDLIEGTEFLGSQSNSQLLTEESALEIT
jgi:hypothetical protein